MSALGALALVVSMVLGAGARFSGASAVPAGPYRADGPLAPTADASGDTVVQAGGPFSGPRAHLQGRGPVAPGGDPATGPQHSAPSQAPRGPAERLAAVSLEVIRLGEVSRRASRSYTEGHRAAREQLAERDRLRTALLREQRLVAALRRSAGAIAGEQYRTGNMIGYTVRQAAAEGRKSLASVLAEAEKREGTLAARLRGAGRESREMASDSATATSRIATLTARSARLQEERTYADRGLSTARVELQQLAQEASLDGSCGRLPRAVSNAARAVAPAAAPRGRWTRPVESYELSAPFGGEGTRWADGHTGQDFAVPVGTSVRAVGGGRVASVTCGDGFGISLVLRHRNGLYSQYAHLSAAMVRPGQRVRPGERIGLSGNTGNSTGPHLHFEVRRTPGLGSSVDPVSWLRRHGVRL
ncbi:peptidoglycan DD-metalloendopeptidase family protein [Streptomyces sp. NPDC048248]|uniref:M23 family metallopeptidase n=1 Tax=Streptomyces sp. NPDC048248 TaxID=3365523 RepID=UPI0037105711